MCACVRSERVCVRAVLIVHSDVCVFQHSLLADITDQVYPSWPIPNVTSPYLGWGNGGVLIIKPMVLSHIQYLLSDKKWLRLCFITSGAKPSTE